jgi:tellurium resistance protein TerD
MSTINLVKGQNISLAKVAGPSLNKVSVGLGWDESAGSDSFDMDVQVFGVDASGKSSQDQFVFYNNLTAPGIQHTGDNLTGDAAGDDETINITLDEVSPSVERIVATVSIHEAGTKGQNMGQISNAYARIYNTETGEEIAKLDLTEDYSIYKSMKVCELYRHNGEWKFKALEEGLQGELPQLLESFGL